MRQQKNKNMIAKINLNGDERMAIVLGKGSTAEDILNLRRSLVTYMESVESGADVRDLDLDDVRYYLFDLLSEMELTDAQQNALLNYFCNDFKVEPPKKENCEIYI